MTNTTTRRGSTRVIITGHRTSLVEIVQQNGDKVTIKRLQDAGANRRPGFDELKWSYTRRGDLATILLSVLEARTIR